MYRQAAKVVQGVYADALPARIQLFSYCPDIGATSRHREEPHLPGEEDAFRWIGIYNVVGCQIRSPKRGDMRHEEKLANVWVNPFSAHGLGWSSRDPRKSAATQPKSWPAR